MYGNDLSSRSRTLNGGRWRLTRFCSRCSASTSLEVTIVSIWSTRFAIVRMPCRVSLEPAWKYERTRGRSDFALPTYSTSPAGRGRDRRPGRPAGASAGLRNGPGPSEAQGTVGRREGDPARSLLLAAVAAWAAPVSRVART